MFEKVRRGYQAGWKGRLLLPKRKGVVLDAGASTTKRYLITQLWCAYPRYKRRVVRLIKPLYTLNPTYTRLRTCAKVTFTTYVCLISAHELIITTVDVYCFQSSQGCIIHTRPPIRYQLTPQSRTLALDRHREQANAYHLSRPCIPFFRDLFGLITA